MLFTKLCLDWCLICQVDFVSHVSKGCRWRSVRKKKNIAATKRRHRNASLFSLFFYSSSVMFFSPLVHERRQHAQYHTNLVELQAQAGGKICKTSLVQFFLCFVLIASCCCTCLLSADVPLTEKGEDEALRAGQALRKEGFEFDMVFSSMLKR